MEQYLTQISHCSLFSRISEEEILHALNLMAAKVVHFEQDAIILHQGAEPRIFGLVLKGCAHVLACDVSGNHTLVSALHEGDLLGKPLPSPASPRCL